jgi:NhaA family Na+:H+ antiporter
MATDIAFVAAVVALAGRRVPPAAKIFLLSLAIVDDLGAIAVIAVFYSHGGSVLALSAAVLTIALAAGLVRLHVRSRLPYALLGIVCWVALHEGGVHPTLAGVAFGFLTPAWSFYDPHHFPARARDLVDEVARSFSDDRFEQHEYERTQVRLDDIVRLSQETAAPLDRLEHALAPWVSFLIVPLFAFANAGLPLSGAWAAGGDVGQRAALGVAVGLVVGKTLGSWRRPGWRADPAWRSCRPARAGVTSWRCPAAPASASQSRCS